eukprot:TRINITY_DN2750_c0_g1_i2.p1 TRINITY_DN2750_c0_g1~~TRINITY_DN2750_c0_g1_i2.p1  ORF type:complete len:449 (-),score=86.72 TRINITY_DN2750_c0_g1_i2:240-1535(-)
MEEEAEGRDRRDLASAKLAAALKLLARQPPAAGGASPGEVALLLTQEFGRAVWGEQRARRSVRSCHANGLTSQEHELLHRVRDSYGAMTPPAVVFVALSAITAVDADKLRRYYTKSAATKQRKKRQRKVDDVSVDASVASGTVVGVSDTDRSNQAVSPPAAKHRRQCIQNHLEIMTNSPRTLRWEVDDVSCGTYPIAVTVVNEVDDERLVCKWQWSRSNRRGKGVPDISGDELTNFCKCRKCDDKCFCATTIVPYDSAGNVLLYPGGYIYECNHLCACGESCDYRVIQRGLKQGPYPVQVFKTPTKGWGLRTLVDIPPRRFVAEYIGEYITNAEAQVRGTSYLFDLDLEDNSDDCFVLDGGTVSNISHFINHSCVPNLSKYFFWVEHADERVIRPSNWFWRSSVLRLLLHTAAAYRAVLEQAHKTGLRVDV